MGYISTHPPSTVVVEVDRVQYDRLNPTTRAVKRVDKVELPPDGILEVPFMTEARCTVLLKYCLHAVIKHEGGADSGHYFMDWFDREKTLRLAKQRQHAVLCSPGIIIVRR